MIRKLFIDGIKAFVPFALTIAILVWLFSAIETFFGGIIKFFIGPQNYFTGLGLIVGIVCVFLVGVIYNAWIVKRLHTWADRLMRKIPLVKTLYNSISDLMGFFSSDKSKKMGKVVTFRWQGLNLIGMVTREDFAELPAGIAGEGEVAVYLPMSYQLGGYTVHVPRTDVKPLDMTVETAMRYIVTAGMSVTPPSTNNNKAK